MSWKCEGCGEKNSDYVISCSCGHKIDRTLLPQNAHEQVILTTSPWLEGYQIVESLEIVTAECVFGMNLFRDFFASVTDVIGGRSGSTQAVLRDARKTCLAELKREADSIGANAVIAVDLDYSEFSGQGKSMLFLVASGTAVRVEKKPISGDTGIPNGVSP